MKKNIKKIIKIFTPVFLRRFLKKLYRRIVSVFKRIEQKQVYARIRARQLVIREELRSISNTRKIRVAFFVIHESVWQYDSVYNLMKNEALFDPVIVVAPYTVYSKENMLFEMNKACKSFLAKGYSVIRSYDEEKEEWIDVDTTINPDIIFFTNPHKLTNEEYYIKHWVDKVLTYYVPYGIMTTNQTREQYNQYFHNVVFRHFVETSIHKNMSEKYSDSKGCNVTVTGYPKCDVFLDSTYSPGSVWKRTNKDLRKLIWAPHHTIETDDKYLAYSCFFAYCDLFFDIAEKYSEQIQIAFKPHPLLKVRLYDHPEWGVERTDAYYKKWNAIDNGQCEEGDYIDLFMTSDAMILDSISFISEYSYLRKPLLFTNRDKTISHKFNDFGTEIYKRLYHAQDENDIIRFIETTVLQQIDPKKAQRDSFFSKYLDMQKSISASREIFEIVREDVLHGYSINNKAR